MANVQTTRECFFELVRQGKINDQAIKKQAKATRRKWEFPLWLVILLSVLIGLLLIGLFLLLFL